MQKPIYPRVNTLLASRPYAALPSHNNLSYEYETRFNGYGDVIGGVRRDTPRAITYIIIIISNGSRSIIAFSNYLGILLSWNYFSLLCVEHTTRSWTKPLKTRKDPPSLRKRVILWPPDVNTSYLDATL